MRRSPLLLAVSCSLIGCSQGASTRAAPTEAVFFTSTAMLSSKLSSAEVEVDGGSGSAGGGGASGADRLRERVRQFFPAACLDGDSDNDGVPDSEDHSLDNATPEAAETAEADSGNDDNALRCHACNRGPGNAGDFRYEEKGTEATLDRGRIVSRTETTIVVAGPSGPITIELTASTQLRSDHGAPTPGAEIRARGDLRAAATRTFQALELEVLCPGPGVVPDAQLPTDVKLAPVPATDVVN